MQPHEQRVLDEKKELDEKISKLSDFMHGDTFANLPGVDQGLLMVQIRAMKMYSEALSQRIQQFAS